MSRTNNISSTLRYFNFDPNEKWRKRVQAILCRMALTKLKYLKFQTIFNNYIYSFLFLEMQTSTNELYY